MKRFSYRKTVFLLSFLFLSLQLYAGGVLSSPRRVYVIKTNHFEILFPKESAPTADFIAKNADSLYEKAKETVGLKNDFSMPVIISPDSTVLDVKYTNHPYNRIVIFDAVPSDGQDSLETLFYKEIFRAVSASVRSPFNEFIHKVAFGDPYQPIAYINLPFSFSEAYADIATDCRNDRYNQQLLVQAKLEGKFPNWIQAAAIRDIHPGNDLSYACGTAFAAYLMQTRGIEKYAEFWEECGKIHLYLMNGIFYRVYGKNLSELWKEFEASVQLPENIEQMNEFEALSSEILENDRQGAYENILYSNYGIVWYDSIRHEVDVFDSNSNFKIRQLLFIADNISKLTLSPDGRYITVSYTRGTSRPDFQEDVTRIYDLKERSFLSQKFMLRDATFLKSKDGQILFAGLSVKEKHSILEVYPFNTEDSSADKIYEHSFLKETSLCQVCAPGNGKVGYLLSENGKTKFVVEDITDSTTKEWIFTDEDGNEISPVSLRNQNDSSIISFTYYPKDVDTLARSGYIKISEQNNQVQVDGIYIQDCDFFGGVYYPVIEENVLYYCAKKFSHNELRYLDFTSVPFKTGKVQITQSALPEQNKTDLFFSTKEKRLGEYPLKLYNPLKYLFNISFTPMLAIRDITIDRGPVYWPSLGLNLCADSDPMRNTEIVLSGGIDFLVLSFEKSFNTVPIVNEERFNQTFKKIKKYSVAAYLENSSTPVDISVGAIFNFNKDGDYDFKGVAKTGWVIPVGNILRDMEFSIASIYSSSTEYYDENKIEYHPPMKGWTPISEAYDLLELSLSMTYSNSHQYGISKYERRGLTVGGRLYSLWDIYEIEQLQKYREETKQQIQEGENTELTEVQLENLYKENMLNISQLNLGLTAMLEIPRITPLEIHNGWVLSVPTVINLELMNKTGNALDVNVEALLIGNEIQNGIPFLYLFFSRVGLKAGYDFKLDYDTKKVQLPDIRRKNYMADVFSQTYISDSVYMILNSDYLIPSGILSEIQFNLNVRGEYYIRTNGFKISLNVGAVF